MRGTLGLAVLLLAGCLAEPAAPALSQPLPAGLEAYTACPVVNGTTWPCEPNDDSPYVVDVRNAVPPGWACLAFADKRFATDVTGNGRYPFPDWSLNYGPSVADGGVRGMAVGLAYDAKGDAAAVGGAMVIDTEGDGRVFVFEGAPAGFVPLPTPITSREVRVYGVLFPRGPTQGLHDDETLGTPRDHWASEPAAGHQEFWSMGPLDTSNGFTAVGTRDFVQWNLVQNVELAGHTLHVPAPRRGPMGFGPSDGSGLGHWGWGRSEAFNATLDAQGLRLDASLQPYVEFYAEFHDLQDPMGVATSHFLCKCPDLTLEEAAADPVLAVRCAAGLASVPVGGRGASVRLDAPQGT